MSGLLVGSNGLGRRGNSPEGAGRMSREMKAEKGDDVYRCCGGEEKTRVSDYW